MAAVLSTDGEKRLTQDGRGGENEESYSTFSGIPKSDRSHDLKDTLGPRHKKQNGSNPKGKET